MLPDYLIPCLDLVFVGLNPGLRSDLVGHYYAGPGNQFWPFLFKVGFTERLLRPEEDASVLDYGIGLTDLVRRPTSGIRELAAEEYRSGYRALAEKLEWVRPRVVCFNGKSGYDRALGHRCDYGLQMDDLAGARVYLAPSTSGALPMLRTEKLAYLELKALLDNE